MKISRLLIYMIIFLIILIACESIQESDQTIDYSQLPDQVSIEFNFVEVDVVEEAKNYIAEFIQLDHKTVIEEIVDGEIDSKEVHALGTQYKTKENTSYESLTIYDGGQAFGTRSGSDGGLTYVNRGTGAYKNYRNIAYWQPGPSLKGAQSSSHRDNRNFDIFSDLDFLPYQEAEDIIIEKLSSIGISGIEAEVVYALDLETISTHYDQYLEERKQYDEVEIELLEWTQEDEAYLFQFRQIIDDIPVSNIIWTDVPRDAGEITETIITVIHTSNGMTDLEIKGFYKLLDSGDSEELITKNEAIDILIEHYQSILITKETAIEKLELNYVGVVEEENYQLKPAWMFEIRTKEEIPEDEETYYEYSYFVIDAITGERIEEMGEVE